MIWRASLWDEEEPKLLLDADCSSERVLNDGNAGPAPSPLVGVPPTLCGWGAIDFTYGGGVEDPYGEAIRECAVEAKKCFLPRLVSNQV